MRAWAFIFGLLLATSAAAQTSTSSTATSQGSGSSSGSGSGAVDGLPSTGSTGIVVETATEVTAARTVTNVDGLISVQNGDGVSANPIFNLDTSAVPVFSQGTADPGATCTPVEFYYETDQADLYFCDSTDHWQLVLSQAAATEDATLIGNGTTMQLKVLADCDDSAGNHLNYDTATNAFSCGTTSSSSAAAEDTTSFHVREEFFAGLATTGNIGTHGWTFSQSGGAGTVTQNVTAQANHPGIFQLTTGTSDNGGPTILGTQIAAGDYSGEDWTMTWVINPEDAVTSTLLSVGMWVVAAESTTSAIRAVYDTDVSHATWIFQLCDSSTTGCQSAGDDTNADTVASTAAPAAGVWQAIEISHCNTCGPAGVEMYSFRVGTAGSFETAKTFCSSGCDSTMANEPTATVIAKAAIIARAASTSKDLFVDLFDLNIASGLVRY